MISQSEPLPLSKDRNLRKHGLINHAKTLKIRLPSPLELPQALTPSEKANKNRISVGGLQSGQTLPTFLKTKTPLSRSGQIPSLSSLEPQCLVQPTSANSKQQR
jgi:hypothetical protein